MGFFCNVNHFNPRTLQESATAHSRIVSKWYSYFNPRTLQESATPLTLSTINNPKFQSTHPTRECDSDTSNLSRSSNLNFNPRTLQESATVATAPAWIAPSNFNPRTLQESATAIYSKKITFSQYIGLKILIRNKKYPSLK